jgi:Ca-activated chloride channel family protein
MEEVGLGNQVNNLELAKEAARRSVEFLFPQDRAGVLSFDSNPQWLVDIQNVNDKTGVERSIGELRPGGGTDILAAVREIARTVPSDPSTLKHVILLTDGGADPNGIVETVQNMHDAYGITVTSIGIGAQVPSFMRDIAVAGHGIYYNVNNTASLPQIFTSDTVLATRSYIMEEEFTPTQSANSQIMQGITAVPSLLGYVATTAKDTATVVLRAPGFDDPLLATWQYGLGRSVAWTSDATSRWARNWTSWEDFGRFWSQAIRYTITDTSANTIDSHVEQRNGQSVLVVDAHDDKGSFLNGLTMEAAVIDPKLRSDSVKLKQVAPGRYEAEIDPQTEGAYFIRIGGAGTDTASGQNVAVAQTTGWVLSYSPEYRLRDTNLNLLDDITRLTSGTFIDGKPELAFSHNVRTTQAATPLAPWLLLIVTILLPLDIAIRRVIITRSDVQKVTTWARERTGFVRAVDLSQATSGKLEQLKAAKDRAATAAPAPINTESIRELARARRDSEPASTGTVEAPVPAATPIQTITPPAPVVRPAPAPKPAAEDRPAAKPSKPDATDEAAAGNTLASRLLDRRRNRDDS